MEEEYYEFVAAVASGPRPSPVILNRSAAHASIILEHLFSTAKERVRIVSRGLSEDVYAKDRVIEAAIRFLKRNRRAKLEILVERAGALEGNAFLEALTAAKLQAQVSVAIVPASTASGYKFNFAVADGDCYRFEDQRTSREATVQFGNPNFGGSLDRVFELIGKASDLPPYNSLGQAAA